MLIFLHTISESLNNFFVLGGIIPLFFSSYGDVLLIAANVVSDVSQYSEYNFSFFFAES